MQPYLAIPLVLIFLTLSLIHFYWVLGGKWGLAAAIPSNAQSGEKNFSPGPAITAVVALGLLSFAFFYFLSFEVLTLELPGWMLSALGWGIPSIFLLRAIGDFKTVGFFKRVRDTHFGRWDSRLFSPLCLLIGLLGVGMQVA